MTVHILVPGGAYLYSKRGFSSCYTCRFTSGDRSVVIPRLFPRYHVADAIQLHRRIGDPVFFSKEVISFE